MLGEIVTPGRGSGRQGGEHLEGPVIRRIL